MAISNPSTDLSRSDDAGPLFSYAEAAVAGPVVVGGKG